MKELLDARFDPATRSWGFLKAPFAGLLRAFEEWLSPMGFGCDCFQSDLRGALSRLTVPANEWKTLLVSTGSPWVAIFIGHASGPQSAISYMVRTCGCDGLLLACVADTYDFKTDAGRLGGLELNVFSPHTNRIANSIRAVWLTHAHDAGWQFGTGGTPLAFEKTERYRAKRVRDRFTVDMLEEYCLALGIRLFDERFYGPDCALFVPTK